MASKAFFALLAVAGAFGLAACAARTVTPVDMTQAGDDQLSCAELHDQIAANQASASDLLHKDKEVENGNAAKIVAGAVVAPLSLSADFSNEEQVKARALIDRNEKLTYLLQKKGCNT